MLTNKNLELTWSTEHERNHHSPLWLKASPSAPRLPGLKARPSSVFQLSFPPGSFHPTRESLPHPHLSATPSTRSSQWRPEPPMLKDRCSERSWSSCAAQALDLPLPEQHIPLAWLPPPSCFLPLLLLSLRPFPVTRLDTLFPLLP